jgi:hypothetical protein
MNRKWARASVLRKENIPTAALLTSGRDALDESRMTFEIRGDINGDGLPDLATVGVYEEHGGDRGLFVAVFTQAQADAWRLAFLESYPGSTGILALRRGKRAIELWSCMECDAVRGLVWNKKANRYAWLPAPKGD